MFTLYYFYNRLWRRWWYEQNFVLAFKRGVFLLTCFGSDKFLFFALFSFKATVTVVATAIEEVVTKVVVGVATMIVAVAAEVRSKNCGCLFGVYS